MFHTVSHTPEVGPNASSSPRALQPSLTSSPGFYLQMFTHYASWNSAKFSILPAPFVIFYYSYRGFHPHAIKAFAALRKRFVCDDEKCNIASLLFISLRSRGLSEIIHAFFKSILIQFLSLLNVHVDLKKNIYSPLNCLIPFKKSSYVSYFWRFAIFFRILFF